MEGLLQPPPPLVIDGNLEENWKKWKQKFELFIVATGLESKEDGRKIAVLLNIIGEDALDMYNTFSLTIDQEKSLEDVINAFEEYCTSKANESVDRAISNARSQQDCGSFDVFLTDLRKLSSTCGFGDLRESLIKDRIISGI
ncbi:hypothetical protein QAD02_021348 [Eretmocerus hayati]|uniref:Uncharacterized protein n=1 Tax=Eretmocerus hayati TaxID=131215 RepID=A0ACC2PPQ0_9HYME|nr:hypothetical protein QAD02_021348 [Eretmocerus hayati]